MSTRDAATLAKSVQCSFLKILAPFRAPENPMYAEMDKKCASSVQYGSLECTAWNTSTDKTDESVISMADSSITVDNIEGELLKIERIRDALVRRESELRYMMDDIQLCKEITRLKKELQKLISVPDKDKANEDRLREEELLQQIQKLVEARDYLVDDVEFERLREREEDKEMADFLKSRSALVRNDAPGRHLGSSGLRQRANSSPSVTKTGLALLKECCSFTCTIM